MKVVHLSFDPSCTHTNTFRDILFVYVLLQTTTQNTFILLYFFFLLLLLNMCIYTHVISFYYWFFYLRLISHSPSRLRTSVEMHIENLVVIVQLLTALCSLFRLSLFIDSENSTSVFYAMLHANMLSLMHNQKYIYFSNKRVFAAFTQLIVKCTKSNDQISASICSFHIRFECLVFACFCSLFFFVFFLLYLIFTKN